MSSPFPNPLHALHEQAEAEFQPFAEIEIVSTFGEPPAEYAAIRKGCAMDLPQRGFLELTGKDRLDFVNRLITNQTYDKQAKSGMAKGEGVYGFYLNLKGRIVADMNVLELGDRTLLEMDARLVEPVRAAFDKYIITDDVLLTNRVGTLHEVALHGPKAGELLAKAAELPGVELKPLQSMQVKLFGVDAIVWRDDPAGVSGYFLILPTDAAAKVWMNLLSTFGGADPLSSTVGKRALRPAGWAAFNAARIEAGRPLFAIDFDDTILPAETGQVARAVSFTKGCYLGQEIVARMHARGQVARQLVGIRMDDDALPIAGSHVFDDKSNQVGGITSSTISPVLSNAAICLGFVKKPFIPVGSELTIPAEGAMHKGKVVALPFLAILNSEL